MNNLSVIDERLELVPKDNDGRPKYTDMEGYSRIIKTTPRAEWVKRNKYAGNAFYLPIGIVEELLREIFPFWQAVQVGEPKILGNSVTISVDLQVYHPLLGQWLHYPGVGAVPIEVQKGASPVDFDKINSKALHKNVPAALSYAINNAAKKIGPLFGSHLNREDDEKLPKKPKKEDK